MEEKKGCFRNFAGVIMNKIYMTYYIPELTAEIATKKFYLRELLSFFLEKRKGVFGDESFIFLVKEFEEFIESKKIKNVMSNALNFDFIKAHLKAGESLFKRNNKLRVIYPEKPILKFKTNKKIMSFNVICHTQYIKTAIKFLNDSLKDDKVWEEGKKKSLFQETQDHKIKFLNTTTKNSLEHKERGIFGVLAGNFNKPCSYGDMFNTILNLNESAPNKKEKLMNDYNSSEKKKRYIDDGIQALRKKLFEISGKPDAIKAAQGRNSEYILTY